MAAVVLVCGSTRGPLGAALGLLAGAVPGLWWHDALKPIPGESPSPWNWLPWGALAALWIGRIARMPEMQPMAGWFLRAATAITIAWVVIPSETRKEADWLAPAFAALMIALWAILERVAAELEDGSVPACLAVAFFTTGLVLIHANTKLLMDAAIVIGSALAGLAPIAWWRRADVSGAIPAVAVMLPGLLLMGHQNVFTEIPWYGFALPALAPLLLAEALPLSQWQRPRLQLGRFALMLVLILIPLGIALYLADKYAPLEDPLASQ
jgi:hypothetical protein